VICNPIVRAEIFEVAIFSFALNYAPAEQARVLLYSPPRL